MPTSPPGHFRVPTNPTHTKSSPYLPLELLATRAFHARTVANNLHPIAVREIMRCHRNH